VHRIASLLWVLTLMTVLVCHSEEGTNTFPGELFKSSDGKQFLKLLGPSHAEVLLPGDNTSLYGSYKLEQDGARVIVTLPGGSLRTYDLRDKDLVDLETGVLLRRVAF
jgi:hypothetical protein